MVGHPVSPRGSAFGSAKEREVAELIRDEGWIVVRTAGSLGEADLVCLKAGARPMLLQVKGGDGNVFRDFGPNARIALKAAATKAGADAFLCRWRGKERRWILVPPSDWPSDLPARRQPDYHVDENGCWIWLKATQKHGYGITGRKGRSCLAHRAYYEMFHGQIPDDRVLDHLCRVPACVNPDHLEPVTIAENSHRGDLTRLTAGQVNHIRASSERASTLARQYGVSRGYIWRLRTNPAFRTDVAWPTGLPLPPGPGFEHGTAHGYITGRCRCRACGAAVRQQRQTRKKNLSSSEWP
jgi:Holliday junction resolvase